MDKDKLDTILAGHKLWMKPGPGGVRANLSGANLIGANLTEANLTEANLIGANLTEANLTEADLTRANLSGANLTRADLTGANLRGANLSGANLSGARGVVCAGIDRRGYRFVGVRHASGWMVKAGCRWFTISEAVEHWTREGNQDALRRVRLIAETSPEA